MDTANTCLKCGAALLSPSPDRLCDRCREATDPNQAGSTDETIDTSTGDRVDRPAVQTKQFGDYELIEEIARGGMGVIYRARHRQLGREVAMKVILRGQLASENDVRRFYLEAEAAANLDHPGIVPIYEVGEHDGNHFYTMKLIEGGSLAQRISDLRADIRHAVVLLAEICRAVQHAHMRGVLHRDLKPANILLDEKGSALVTDLGLVKQIQSESDLTGTGAIVGTPAYMAPEQASAEKEITTAADIYSLGAMLYEILVGHPPHQADSPVQLLMKVVSEDVTPPSRLNKRIDRSLELICLKCLERDPQSRYSSAAALASDLESWLEGRRISVRPPSMASVASELFYSNLRSAIGAAAIGANGRRGFRLRSLRVAGRTELWRRSAV